jgi:hypothetical protein
MPKRISQNELDKILGVVASFPEGAGIGEISGVLGKDARQAQIEIFG